MTDRRVVIALAAVALVLVHVAWGVSFGMQGWGPTTQLLGALVGIADLLAVLLLVIPALARGLTPQRKEDDSAD